MSLKVVIAVFPLNDIFFGTPCMYTYYLKVLFLHKVTFQLRMIENLYVISNLVAVVATILP